MARYSIDESTLIEIANAIREKTENGDLLSPIMMAHRIREIETGGGGADIEPFVLEGDCTYACGVSALSNKMIELFGDKISTFNISVASNMFENYQLTHIPFELNMHDGECDVLYMFSNCPNLEELPRINNLQPKRMRGMFADCSRLRYFPDGFTDTWNWDALHNQDSYIDNVFRGCYSLREIPQELISNIYGTGTNSNKTPFSSYHALYVLDRLENLPALEGLTISGNMFANAFLYLYRLSALTFATDDGVAKTATWKKQIIDLTNKVGYGAPSESFFIDYNSGLTLDTRVVDDDTYQALKDNPDYWTTDIAYSRYNRDSAVATINSLPDTSAYAVDSSINTIKFEGQSGSRTDGGAINTLTEEEIAVAAAKGWTVSFV